MQLGRGLGLALAQRREGGRFLVVRALGGERGGGAVGDREFGGGEALGGAVELGARRAPAQMQHHRLGAADVIAEPAIAPGLARLLLQPVELRGRAH